MNNNSEYHICKLITIHGHTYYFATEFCSDGQVITIGPGCQTWEDANTILQAFLDNE